MSDDRELSEAESSPDVTTGQDITITPPLELKKNAGVTQQSSALEREVRFAVVMYGGVSLAIYINGIAQELLRLVRSTAAASSAGMGNTERVYRKLNYLLANKQGGLAGAEEAVKSDQPVCTKFLVDIVAGTSAGGINGIYLAKALANGQNIDELRRLWVTEGDINLLVNDKRSVEKPLSGQDPPQSLLNSRRMYVKLLRALSSMDGVDLMTAGPGAHSAMTGVKDSPDQCRSPLVKEIDLFVTATDIQGVPLPLRLRDDVVFERRHRNVFHFIYSQYTTRNDFMEKYNPFLAYAARCTSSFPVAFEPMRLCDIDDILEGFSYYRGDTLCRSDSERWQRFFKDYLNPTGVKTIPFAKRSFGDGGYLDNKPFSDATDTLMRRNADVPVDRKLIYIEPSPEHPENVPEQAEKPDFLKNALAALLTIPRYETIREDLKRVREHNRFITRVNRIVRGVEKDVEHASEHDAASVTDEDWANLDLAAMTKRKGRGYAGYHRLEIASVTDGLAELVTRVARFDEESDYFLAVRYLVRAWRDRNYGQYRDGKRPTMNEFLWSFNLAYPLRRLNFLRSKIDDLHDRDTIALETLRMRSPEYLEKLIELGEEGKKQFRAELLSIKTVLNIAYKELLDEARLLRSPANPRNPLRELISGMGIGSEELDYILGKRDVSEKMMPLVSRTKYAAGADSDADQFEEECVARGCLLLDEYPALTKALQTVSDKLATQIKNAKKDADIKCRAAMQVGEAGLQTNPAVAAARTCVRYYYEQYDNFDMITFPILYGTEIGEADQVEIIRISPEDAKALIDERKVGCLKLAGTALGHFGAFLEALWRENDILWGRLDGAERIITALLPDNREQARQLTAEAHAGIICDAINEKGVEELKQLLIESMMRTRNRTPDTAAFCEFLNNLTAEITDQTLKATVSRNIDPRELRDYYLEHYEVNSKLRPEPTLRVAARATTVIGKMLEGLSEKYNRGGKVAAWIARLGRIFWGLVEVAVPRSIPNIVAHHALKLLYLFEGLLIAGGIVFVSPTMRDLGWRALGATLAVHAAILLLSDVMLGKSGKWRAVKTVLFVVVALVLLLGIYEVWAHLADDIGIWLDELRGNQS